MTPLEIKGFTYCHSSSEAYTMILGEINGKLRLPIIIGENETQAIVLGMEKAQLPRPDTHSMMLELMKSIGVSISSVVINKFTEGVFHADLICITSDGKTIHTDARPSDAIALAVRVNCPIMAEDKLMNDVGIDMFDLNFEEQKLEDGNIEIPTSDPLNDPTAMANEYIRFNSSTEAFIDDCPQMAGLPKDTLATLYDKYIKIAIEQEDYTSAAKIRDMLKNLNEQH